MDERPNSRILLLKALLPADFGMPNEFAPVLDSDGDFSPNS
jgi:hypothetical protein